MLNGKKKQQQPKNSVLQNKRPSLNFVFGPINNYNPRKIKKKNSKKSGR